MRKGQRIHLQYVSGTWKGWDKYATESPDAKVPQDPNAGDRCRLVICEVVGRGQSRVLVVVPPSTMNNPFEWSADRDYDRIIFRINDNDGDFASNPDEGVRYQLQVLPADNRSTRGR
jgi:hypothetical protein